MTEVNLAITSNIDNLNKDMGVLNEIYNNISNLIIDINLQLDPLQIKLTLSNLITNDIINLMNSTIVETGDFSDLIIQRGKDILLLADQATQFICVANDAFDRVVDNWNWMTSQDMYVEILLISKDLKDLILNYFEEIFARKDLLLDDELLITQELINSCILSINAKLDEIAININNIKDICRKSKEVNDIFKNVLFVNSTVGIALSVTERAWQIMKRINKFNYKTTETKLDEIIDSTSSLNLRLNPLLPKSVLSQEVTNNNLLIKLLTNNVRFEKLGKAYYITNKKDTDTNIFDLPESFDKLYDSQIRESYIPEIPYQVLEVINEIGMVQVLGNIDIPLVTEYYNSITAPGFTLEEFIQEFQKETFIKWYNKYLDGSVINNIINYNNNKKQYFQLQSVLKEYNILVEPFIETNIFPEIIYNLKGNVVSSGEIETEVQNYINLSRLNIIDSNEYLTKINELKNNFVLPLVTESFSGQLTISRYNIIEGKETLEEVIDQFKYSVKIYKNDFKMHYAEVKINKNDYFTVNQETMNSNYLYNEEVINNLTFIEKINHRVKLEHVYKSFINTYEFIGTYFEMTSLIDNIERVVEDKMAGIKKIILQDLVSSINVDESYNITSTTNETDIETHWVTNNLIERVSVDVTNIYRDELINSRMDFTQARVNSIISTLRFLGYRELLDQYIDDTWTYKIPRYQPQVS